MIFDKVSVRLRSCVFNRRLALRLEAGRREDALYLLYLGISEHSLLGIRAPP